MALQPWQIEQIEREVRFEAVRSRGPGGQNVNKVSSAAVLYWRPDWSTALLNDQRERVLAKAQLIWNADCEIMFRSDEMRDLPRNKSRVMEKLLQWLNTALHRPKKRVATRPTRASKERKLESKAHRSKLKQSRRRVHDHD